MKYSEVLYLISKTYQSDEIGNLISSKEVKTKCFASLRTVGTKEFYNAIAVGIKPSYEFEIRLSNYNNELEIEYENCRYSIVRTIPKKRKNKLIIVVSKKTGINE